MHRNKVSIRSLIELQTTKITVQFGPLLILHLAMKEGLYSTIVLLLALVTAYGPIFILIKMGYKGRRLYRLVATYAFYRILKKKKTDKSGATRWLLKDVDLTREEKTLNRVVSSFFFLFLVLFGGVVGLFYHLLLLEVRFHCEPNMTSQDCFKYSMLDLAKWETIKRFSREPVDCNSTAALEGTVDVICYKLVFNIGLASGAGYSGFQICMVLLNLATSALLMCKQKKTIFKLKVTLFFMSFVFLVVFVGVQVSELRHFLFSDNLVIGFQMTVSVVVGYCFMYGVPWKKLLALRKAQKDTDLENNRPAVDSEATGTENAGVDSVSLTERQKEEQEIQTETKTTTSL